MVSRIIKYVEASLYKTNINPLFGAVLRVLSFFYGLGVRLRLFLYSSGILKSTRVPVPVISIGNLTVGGSGKTPLTVYIASLLNGRGKKTAILTRGYKRKSGDICVINNADLKNHLKEPELYGDEPLTLALRLKDTPVIISPDRIASAKLAVKKYSPDVLLLDDGFQHLRLARNINFALFDSARGTGSGALLPRGPLREPMSSLQRADAIILKGSSDVPGIGFAGKPVFRFSLNPTALKTIDGKTTALDYANGKRAFVFSAISNPASFRKTVESLGATIVTSLSYTDHHWFNAEDLADIKRNASEADLTLTTEKDLVRLGAYDISALNIFAVSVDAVPENKTAFDDFIFARIWPGK
ncbi:MAG: tetraacyldisaccharide 4'-kinase [Deltaproteobacteria bacterium]|nr:tetraacyldisaccharide 4'-kinase [Deltaproteobacteria bacterium]